GGASAALESCRSSREGRMRERRWLQRSDRGRVGPWLALIAVAMGLAAACGPEPSTSDQRGSTAADTARILTMFARGYSPGRWGQLFVVPNEGEFVAGVRDSDIYYFMHGSPWDYDTRIPLLFFWPGHVNRKSFPDTARQQDI